MTPPTAKADEGPWATLYEPGKERMDHESEIQPKDDHPQRSPEQVVVVKFETKKAKFVTKAASPHTPIAAQAKTKGRACRKRFLKGPARG